MVIWIVFPILSIFGVNYPVLRLFYAFTYANGGMFGGYFGALGGVFGKIVFAIIVNTFIFTLVAKKNPFANVIKSLKGIFTKESFSGIFAISPFLFGAGIALVLYWMFNITSSVVNCSIAIVCAVGAFSALGKTNGILSTLIYFVIRKLSKDKIPTQEKVDCMIFGISAGFILGFPLTFVRFGWLILILGGVILVTGIVFYFIGKNGTGKAVRRTAALILISAMMLSIFSTNVFAANKNLSTDNVSMKQVLSLKDNKLYPNIDGKLNANVLSNDVYELKSSDFSKFFNALLFNIATEKDPDYKRYRGRLTYKNGEVNKYGQPFPDLMDFNNDGVINSVDISLQFNLAKNPDLLELPKSQTVAVVLAVIIAIIGAACGSLIGFLGTKQRLFTYVEGLTDEGVINDFDENIDNPEKEKDLDANEPVIEEKQNDTNA